MLLSVLLLFAVQKNDPPAGGISPLAWVIILALVAALGIVSLFFSKWNSRLYDDLKECNASKAGLLEEVLGLLKVVRIQMEKSKGGKQK